MLTDLPQQAVACLAGRRIDAPRATPARFPANNEPTVKEAIEQTLATEGVTMLVCSAACGADIIALEICAARAIPATIVLPFEVRKFRAASVTDRPGKWGPRFDRVVEIARAEERLVVLENGEQDQRAFERTNGAIVARAASILADRHIAIIVWDGEKEDETDLTGQMLRLARERGFDVREVSTLAGRRPAR